ncbi:MAG: phosphonate ABC transporter substrate-binding protein, partial [Beijerinckiaceae bacterium]
RIPGSPFIYITSLPADMRAAIKKAFLDMPTKSKDTLDRMTDGKSVGFGEMKHSDYQVTIELQKFVDELRKKRGS